MTTLRLKHFLLSLALLGVMLGGVVQSRPARADLLLKPGDRVVFLGDSITEFRNYTRPVEEYVAVRYPGDKVRFFNAGWSGNTAGDGIQRLDRDVLSLNPTLVTICFGMNDARYTTLSEANLNDYRANMDRIVQALQAKHVRVVVFSPSCVDYDARPPLRAVDYNKTLEAFAAAAGEIAKKYDCPYFDILHPMLAAQTALKAKNPAFTMIPDGIHPDEKGGLVMGGLMLQGLGAAPMPPLADVPATALTGDKASGDYTLALAQPALVPLWMTPESVEPARASGVLALVGQTLRVRGLPPGAYDVQVNGGAAGRWSAAALGAGVLLPPSYSPRAQRLSDVTNLKENNYYNAWRVFRIGTEQDAATQGATAGLLAADDGYQAAVESLSAPASPVQVSLQVVESADLPAGLGPNLALKKPYEVSDPNGYSFGIGGLTDGSWDAGAPHVFATGDKDAFPKTATIDLGSVSILSDVLLGVPPFGSTKTIAVSVSADGQTFTPVGSRVFALGTEARRLYAFKATPARYVRLTYPDHYAEGAGYTPTFAFTSEVEVYGPAHSPAVGK